MHCFKVFQIITIICLQIILYVNYIQATHLKNEICGLPHSVDGNGLIACAAYIPSWSYDTSKKECVNFVYGGCGGNLNRFSSHEECQKMCI